MKKFFTTAVVSVILSLSLCACSFVSGFFENSAAPADVDGLRVEFLDVGQADCIFIYLPNGEHAMIDGGNNADGPLIVDYLRSRGIEKIDYLFATHPHEDHIGGLDDVVSAFEIGRIYMPKIAEADIPTTKTYEDLLDAVAAKGYKATRAVSGTSVIDEDGLELFILGPMRDDYGSLNEYSIVARLEYNGRSFLFTGDAETDNEVEIRKSEYNIKSDVLKVGHHGSTSSTTNKFLAAVDPEYAVISCGSGNSYGHPHAETLNKLKKADVTVLRTDLEGSVIMTVSPGSSEIEVVCYTDICLDGNR